MYPHKCTLKKFKKKKVLLRERKRHTARRVVSTPSVVLPGYPPWGWGGYPDLGTPPRGGYPPPLGRGTRTWVPPGGYLDLGGYPDPPGGVPGPGYPPGQVPLQGGTQVWVPPWGGPGPGYPPWGGTWPGYPPRCLMAFWEMLQSIMGYGYPRLWTDRLMDGQTHVKTLPSLILRTRAVKSTRKSGRMHIW